ncbi:MAG TPA: glucose 1-dehydrogenase [Bryobacteraceae bacterium]|nr:glucose 1-dehydrogenase [Bryobacteraceae bacterium]
MSRLANKTAIITGAAAGIGKAIAQKFLDEGASVTLADVNDDGLRVIQDEWNCPDNRMLLLHADVGSIDDTRRIVTEAHSRFGGVHVLVNNAATTLLQKPVQEMSFDEWDRCLSVSLRSVFALAKWAGPVMRDSGGGTIINLSSVGAITPWAGGAAYCAAKSGILALTKVLAAEYAPWNIRVNAISPGAIMTPNLQASIERNQHRDRINARTLLGRIGEGEEVANVAVFLASAESSYITGANLVVDGGWLSR